MRKVVAKPSREKRNERGNALRKVANAFQSFRPAREVLRVVRAVPTCFVQLDHATGVGGLPIERFMLVHGPSNEGKTAFVQGLMKSFLRREHFAMFIDAEQTTPITWTQELMGVALAGSDRFFAERPTTYENTVKHVREFLLTVDSERTAGRLDPDTSAIVVVDSLRKLVPEKIFDKIAGETKKAANSKQLVGIDGMGGRAAQLKAALNAAWMDELVPLLARTQTAFVAITRESEDPNADQWAKMTGNDFKVGGGKAIVYDSSLVFRVERAGYVTDGAEEKKTMFGERHRVTVRKTKVAGREDQRSWFNFYTSNGKLVPSGFDPARDVIELAQKFGVIDVNGSWLSFQGQKLGQGMNSAVKNLTSNADLFSDLEVAVRSKFKPVPDADGVIS